MIDGSFHLFKHDFLKGQIITYKQPLRQKAGTFIEHCRNQHFGELYGLTPLQVLNGEVPDKKKFANQIQTALKERRKANKGFRNCNASNLCK
ncbi:MAG: hypothetical protein EOP48_19030 [Sphingobacteriales bacterium]|nr:MAG: hypothetical protein EOP48_19030 [Sphingobacteriales bacterium]